MNQTSQIDNVQNQMRLINSLSVVGLILYPLIFKVFQGLDLTDQGYFYSNYQLIFSHPEDLKATFIIWLSNIIGGVWYLLFHSLGMPAMQFSGVFTVYLTIYLSYQTLKDTIPPQRLLLLLLVSEIVIYTHNWPVNYNNLTALFFVLMAYLFKSGLHQNKNSLIFGASFVATLNMFIRLPNLLGIALLFGVLLFEHKTKHQTNSELMQKFFWMVLGIVVGLGCTLGIMHIMGHLEIFLESLHSISKLAGSTQDSHGIKVQIWRLMKEYQQAIPFTLNVLMISLGLALGIHFTSRFAKISRIYFICSGLYIASLCYFYEPLVNFAFFIRMLSFSTLFLCGLYFYQSQSSKERAFLLLAAGILIITPMGSNMGLYNSIYGLWLALPLALEALLYKINCFFTVKNAENDTKLIQIKMNPILLQHTQVVLFILLVSTAICHGFKYTYRDSLNRFELVYPLNYPGLYGMFTHQERAKLIIEVLNALKTRLKPDDILFAFGNLPMIHYLTNSRPYLPHPWPNLLSYEALELSLKQASSQHSQLPLVLLHKYEVRNFTWPREKKRFYDKKDLIQLFLTTNHYQPVWENEFFEIWQHH